MGDFAALLLNDGERSNFVLWLSGDDGQIPPFSAAQKTISAHERWTTHAGNKDSFAPF